MPAADGDLSRLAADAIAALTRYPFYIRIPDFGDNRGHARTLADRIVRALPVHPFKPFENARSASIRIDAEAFAMEGDGTRYSRTEQALPAHTDSSFLPEPHELVSFLMVRPGAEGGESFIVTARDAIASLDGSTRERLRAPRFPFGGVLRPILSGDAADPKLRYYRRQIDEEAAGTGALAAAERAALDALDAELERPELQHRFQLAEGEIVLLNNLRVLHGRTGMPATSNRLLYRMRAWAGCLL
jgi:alpha-ketoglutarate-dependent taurine dioxygenase